MTWKIVEKCNIGRGAEGNKVIFYWSGSVRVYLQRLIFKKLGIALNSILYCDVYKDGSRIMIQFLNERRENSRKVSARMFSLPRWVVEEYLPSKQGKKEVIPTYDKGNLVIDLRGLRR